MPFLHCKNERKRAQNVQNSEFAYYASKSVKWIKQTPTPPFLGDVGVKKWSQILDSGTRSPIFGNLKMGTFPKNGHFQACRQGSPRVAKGRQGFPRSKGDPRDGWDELKPDWSYLSHFPPWYSKSKSAPFKSPLKTTRSVKNYKHLKNDSNHENPGVFSNSWPKGTQKQLVQVWGVNFAFSVPP